MSFLLDVVVLLKTIKVVLFGRESDPMKFTKMHGIGNDYVYINCFEEVVKEPAKLVTIISDRHFGVGSDGLILILPSKVADCKMRIFNADGSEAQMCGNGIRCVAKYVYDHKIAQKSTYCRDTCRYQDDPAFYRKWKSIQRNS